MRNSLKNLYILCAAGIAFATSAVAPAIAQAPAKPFVVYSNGLQNGWQSWSWAKVGLDFDAGKIHAMKIEGDAWTALNLHHDAFSTAGYTKLVFYINGGIDGLDAVQAHLQHVDGVMLGRLAYHDPYALACIDAALTGAVPPSRQEVMLRMRAYIERQRAGGIRLAAVTRHVLGLYHGEVGGKAFRRILSERTHAADAGWEAVEAALDEARLHAERRAA